MTVFQKASFFAALLATLTAFSATAQQLPELDSPSTLSGTETSARFFGGVSADDGESFDSQFEAATPVDIRGSIQVEAAHVDTVGNFYTVVQLDDQNFYLDSTGAFKTWDGLLASLGASNPRTFQQLNRQWRCTHLFASKI